VPAASERPPLERLLDLALYAPIGMYTALKEELPAFTKQGRQVVENRVMLARFIGQMAVQQGRREVDKRLAARRPPASSAVVDTVAHEATSAPTDVAAPVAPVATVAADEVPSADSLAISGYESLPAVNVVQRLATLTADEIEQIRRFEIANRGRRTILAKIDVLQGA
jgi:phage I-like protein